MNISKKYILKRIIHSSISTLLTLLIFMMSFRIFEVLKDSDFEGVSVMNIVIYISMNVPMIVNNIFLPSILIGSIIALSKMVSSNEIVVLMVGGISKKEFSYKVMFDVFVITLVFFVFGESITPKFNILADDYKSEIIGKVSQKNDSKVWVKVGNSFIRLDNEEPYNVLNIELSGDRVIGIYKADKHSFKEKNLYLENMKGISIGSDDNFFKINSHINERLDKDIILGEDFIMKINKDPVKMNIFEIANTIFSSHNSINTNKHQLEFYSRLSKPFLATILVFLIITKVFKKARNHNVIKDVSIGLMLVLLTNLLINLTSAFSLKFAINPLFSTVFPLIVLLSFGMYLFITRT